MRNTLKKILGALVVISHLPHALADGGICIASFAEVTRYISGTPGDQREIFNQVRHRYSRAAISDADIMIALLGGQNPDSHAAGASPQPPASTTAARIAFSPLDDAVRQQITPQVITSNYVPGKSFRLQPDQHVQVVGDNGIASEAYYLGIHAGGLLAVQDASTGRVQLVSPKSIRNADRVNDLPAPLVRVAGIAGASAPHSSQTQPPASTTAARIAFSPLDDAVRQQIAPQVITSNYVPGKSFRLQPDQHVQVVGDNGIASEAYYLGIHAGGELAVQDASTGRVKLVSPKSVRNADRVNDLPAPLVRVAGTAGASTPHSSQTQPPASTSAARIAFSPLDDAVRQQIAPHVITSTQADGRGFRLHPDQRVQLRGSKGVPLECYYLGVHSRGELAVQDARTGRVLLFPFSAVHSVDPLSNAMSHAPVSAVPAQAPVHAVAAPTATHAPQAPQAAVVPSAMHEPHTAAVVDPAVDFVSFNKMPATQYPPSGTPITHRVRDGVDEFIGYLVYDGSQPMLVDQKAWEAGIRPGTSQWNTRPRRCCRRIDVEKDSIMISPDPTPSPAAITRNAPAPALSAATASSAPHSPHGSKATASPDHGSANQSVIDNQIRTTLERLDPFLRGPKRPGNAEVYDFVDLLFNVYSRGSTHVQSFDAFVDRYYPQANAHTRSHLATHVWDYMQQHQNPFHLTIEPVAHKNASTRSHSFSFKEGDKELRVSVDEQIMREAQSLLQAGYTPGKLHHGTGSAALDGIERNQAILSAFEAGTHGETVKTGEFTRLVDNNGNRVTGDVGGLRDVFASEGAPIDLDYSVVRWFDEYPLVFEIDQRRQKQTLAEQRLKRTMRDTDGEGATLGPQVPLDNITIIYGPRVHKERVEQWLQTQGRTDIRFVSIEAVALAIYFPRELRRMGYGEKSRIMSLIRNRSSSPTPPTDSGDLDPFRRK